MGTKLKKRPEIFLPDNECGAEELRARLSNAYVRIERLEAEVRLLTGLVKDSMRGA